MKVNYRDAAALPSSRKNLLRKNLQYKFLMVCVTLEAYEQMKINAKDGG